MRFFKRDSPQQRPNVQWDDINRLMAESTHNMGSQLDDGVEPGGTIPLWCEKEGVDEDVLKQIALGSTPLLSETFSLAKREGMTVKDMADIAKQGIGSLAIMYFMIGWDAHREYGEVKGQSVIADETGSSS